MFKFYPIFRGIYISFLDYNIFKHPVVGGIQQFLIKFGDNFSLSGLSTSPLLLTLLGATGICAGLSLLSDRTSRTVQIGLIFFFLIILTIISGPVINETMTEINYTVRQDRVLPLESGQNYADVLKKRYENKENIEVVTEKIDEDKLHIQVIKSMWVGLQHYNRMFINRKFQSFANGNYWYLALVVAVFFGGFFLYLYSGEEFELGRLSFSTFPLKIFVFTLLAVFLAITWRYLFHSESSLFYQGMKNSLTYILVVPPLQIASVLVAILVNQRIPGVRIFRTLFYIPVISGVVIIGYTWKMVFSSTGLLNGVLRSVGLLAQGETIAWLGNSSIALWVVMFVTFWRGIGYYMILYLAGLQGVSKDVIEAAKVDGASGWQLIRRIYFPLLKPTIIVCSMLSTIAALKVFSEIYVLTRGTADTQTMVYLIYQKAFDPDGGFHLGLSSALAVVLSIVIGGISLLLFRLRGKEAYV
ncbi:sugar ABC transporter permease [Candidatus Bipolaricaulota bacterium]|nr:sugar ABC transporter permease [Candidatus Bipolaricaulota bacterium]